MVEAGEEGAEPVLRELVRSVLLRAEVELVRRSLAEGASVV